MNTRSFINAQAERALVLQRLAKGVAQRPYVLVALTLYWTWVNMAFQGPLFFPPVGLQDRLLLPLMGGASCDKRAHLFRPCAELQARGGAL